MKTGIWIDKEKAHIVTLQSGEEHLETIYSEIENYKPSGGARSKVKWGPQDVVQDSKYTEREKHQLKKYFKQIAEKINDTEGLVIFGPAGTNVKLADELHQNYKTIAAKIKGVEKADSMTLNQIKALVRDFYKQNA
jgi:stalled ribosome rescue protein Dom34